MPSFDRRLELLTRLAPEVASAALVSTLPHASIPERRQLLRALLDLAIAHPQSGVVRAMLHHWRHVDEPSRVALIALAAPDLIDLLRVLMQSEDGADHAAARQLALEAARLAFAPEDDSRIEGVRGVLRGALVSDPGDTCLAAAATRLEEIRSPPALEALMWIAAGAGPRVRSWLRDQGQAGHMPLRAAARAINRERRRSRAVAWLGVPALSAVGCETIDREFTEGRHLGSHLESAHLIRARSRALTLRRSAAPRRLLDALTSEVDLTPRARRGRVGWIEALASEAGDKAEALARTWTDPSISVRLDAVLALARLAPTKPGDDALSDFAFDPAEVVARSALASLIDSHTPARRAHHLSLFEKLERSSHASVRATTRAAARWSDPLETSGSHAAAILAHRQDPSGFVHRLRDRLEVSEGAEAMSGLDLAARLGILDSIEDRIIQLVRGDDRRSTSKAVLLLGHLSSEQARLSVLAALDHPDGRVRANALEALSRLDPRSSRLDSFLEDQIPRVRANAIHHRVRTHEQIDDLASMLSDSRPGHRLSGLWVARRRREVRLASHIAELSTQDPAPVVRESARRCARDLLAAMRHGWSDSAPRTTIVTRPMGDQPRQAG